MDKHCEGDLRDQFDLIVGTSTGGILAIGLGLGISPNDLLKLYVEKGPEIFGQGRGWGSGQSCEPGADKPPNCLRSKVRVEFS